MALLLTCGNGFALRLTRAAETQGVILAPRCARPTRAVLFCVASWVQGVHATPLVGGVEGSGYGLSVGSFGLRLLILWCPRVSLPVASAEFSTNIYVHAGHSSVDDLRVSTLKDHGRSV